MTKDQKDQIVKAIRLEMRESVNGKIDKLSHKLDEYIVADNIWKEGAQPSLDNMANLSGAWRVIIAFVSAMTIAFTFYSTIKTFFLK